MTYVITQACIDVKDLSCLEVCPVDCIYSEDVDRVCYVHPTECIDCAACEAACPVGAIFEEKQLPSDETRFSHINEIYFSNPEAARSLVDEIAEGEASIT